MLVDLYMFITSNYSFFQVVKLLELLEMPSVHASTALDLNLMIIIGLLASCVLHSIMQIKCGIVEK
jgi:hypothetical protein